MSGRSDGFSQELAGRLENDGKVFQFMMRFLGTRDVVASLQIGSAIWAITRLSVGSTI